MTAAPQLPYRRCVGVMLLNQDNKVWVGRRLDAPGNIEGNWTGWSQMPQGGIDAGEDPATAARRELYEETSVTSAEFIEEASEWYAYDFPPEIMNRSIASKFCGQEQRWFAMRFTGHDSEIDISAPDGHSAEFDAWKWVGMNELVDLIIPFKRSVYEKVVKAFAHLDT